eukprot:TRINITY_DN2958_c0_g1_i2.p1 TRINITY_DN2958_c0_g1~~TRINITY_DN2958_c0_g1_i2.p1  ORF type:complete len:384 (-),score=51.73 TRINITY_DN2958_c0_g1_i2:57-1208(-)
MTTGEEVKKLPDLELATLKFHYLADPNGRSETKQKLLEDIAKHNMVHFYEQLCETFRWDKDENLLEKMKKANEEKLKAIEEKIVFAEKNQGDTEVREALLEKAEHLADISDFEEAKKWLRVASDKTVGTGQKLDIIFTFIRIGFFENDIDLITRNIEKAKDLIEQGGDWDRRNRLKVYKAYYYLSIRNFSEASKLFLETLSTFTSYELFSYQTFILYTVITSILTLDRVSLREKCIDSPEIKTIIHELPDLRSLLHSFYNSEYASFFKALASVSDVLKLDRFFSPHVRYYCREMRIRAYAQLLESYRSVTLESMAKSFGVSQEFLDRELSRFIALGRLHCKIDSVAGIVETNRPDTRNAQYLSTIKQGDLLLNRIQKLSRVYY